MNSDVSTLAYSIDGDKSVGFSDIDGFVYSLYEDTKSMGGIMRTLGPHIGNILKGIDSIISNLYGSSTLVNIFGSNVSFDVNYGGKSVCFSIGYLSYIDESNESGVLVYDIDTNYLGIVKELMISSSVPYKMEFDKDLLENEGMEMLLLL